MPCVHQSFRVQQASLWWQKSSDISGIPPGLHPAEQVKTGFTSEDTLKAILPLPRLGSPLLKFCWLPSRTVRAGRLKSPNTKWGATSSLVFWVFVVFFFIKSNIFKNFRWHMCRLQQTLRDLMNLRSVFPHPFAGFLMTKLCSRIWTEPTCKLTATMKVTVMD